ncbi:MAG: hypothetical protein ACO3MV_01600 [Flavobacteriales bacterium]
MIQFKIQEPWSRRAKFLAKTMFFVPLVGCLPEPSFPDEPLIEFQSFELTSNGGRELVIQFSDGDGNVGLGQSDTLPPFCPSCEFHQNLKCEYQEWRDEQWVEITLNPDAGQIPFYYRVPPAVPTGQNQSQNGTIAVAMNSWYLNSAYDSVRFRITLYDRDLNASNEAYTLPVLKP